MLTGNTGDKEDVIFKGCLEDLTEDGWILIVNAGMADCRDFDIVLLDKNFRLVLKRAAIISFSLEDSFLNENK